MWMLGTSIPIISLLLKHSIEQMATNQHQQIKHFPQTHVFILSLWIQEIKPLEH